ncbi:MAG: hypothetical protein GWN58_28795 [Anaerolineae bacterium]|nr:hypothetical protein [Anaerolineae bacterium]
MSLASEHEGTIRDFGLPGLEGLVGDKGFVLPHYGGYSIANLARTIVSLFGGEQEEALAQAGLEPGLPRSVWEDLTGGVRTVVVVILDAVGYLGFKRLLEQKETGFGWLVEHGEFVPLTSVFPSTTMAAMSTIWTGRTPADHGFLGRRLYLPEYGLLADMIRLMPAIHGQPGSLMQWGWEPEAFIPVPHLAQLLSNAGCRTVAHLYGPHAGGGLSRLFLRGVERIEGFINCSDMWINVRETLTERTGAPLLVSAYWAGTDDVAHRYGPEDERLEAAVRQIAQSFEQDFLTPLLAAAREGTVVIVTSDHGQVETPPEQAVHLSEHPRLKEMLLWPPTAEPRASYLHVRPRCAEMARDYLSTYLGDRFLVLDMEDVVSAGLFGPGEMPAESRNRLGDLLLLARDDSRLIPEGASAADRGEHGGLRPEEMLVPLLMARLDG